MVGDIESVKKEIAAVLRNAAGAIDQHGATVFFNATLDAVNAEKADGYTTPYPQMVYDHERAVLEGYPAAELQGVMTAYAGEDDVKVAGHVIAVIWSVVGDNEATVTTDVERLVRATREVFWRSVLSADLGLAPLQVQSDDYSALAADKDHPFLKGGRVVLQVPVISN